MEEPKTVTLSLWDYTGLIIIAVAGWTAVLVLAIVIILAKR